MLIAIGRTIATFWTWQRRFESRHPVVFNASVALVLGVLVLSFFGAAGFVFIAGLAAFVGVGIWRSSLWRSGGPLRARYDAWERRKSLRAD